MGTIAPGSGALGTQTMGLQKTELSPSRQGPQVCVPGGRTRSQMTDTPATHHPSASAPRSRHPALAHRWPSSHVDSHHSLPVQGMPSEGSEGAPSPPQGYMAGCQPHCPHGLAPTVQVALAYLASFSHSGPQPTSLVCEGSGSGVVLSSSPWAGVSEVVWMGGHCLSRVTRIPRRAQPTAPPGGVRTKASETSLLRACSTSPTLGSRKALIFTQVLRLGHRWQ